MFVAHNVLDEELLSKIDNIIKDEDLWEKGNTSDVSFSSYKNNTEIQPDKSPEVAACIKEICNVIVGSEDIRKRTLLKSLQIPKFNKYSVGAFYNIHADCWGMGSPTSRTDISFTIFLNNPDEYKGGELIITEAGQEQRSIKLPKGSAVFYPSSTLHKVNPVTEGTRYACISWMNSVIRDELQRKLLVELLLACDDYKGKHGVDDIFARIGSCHHNLMRMWSE